LLGFVGARAVRPICGRYHGGAERGGETAEITLEDVGKVYPDGTRAVKDLGLDIGDGEFMVFVGPSGCGKTTALRMVAGLEDITEGAVKIGDRVVNEVPPKDRDVAMVFQNYALYPHMTVYDNMAFALKLRKVDKPEIDRRVKEAARILGLQEFLDKKPRNLSGGQRQRVAMGRAIVREPQAFLMDEPLSNLDAKLRVQTRAEISRIQRELKVTTIYVTHDQTEAMTLGDRVAVIRKGELQQVERPQVLYDRPVNLFVAGFIGSPAMNMVGAELSKTDGRLVVEFGGFQLTIDEESVQHHPGLERYAGRTVILGIRPEDFEDAAFAGDAPQDRRVSVKVDLVEALGSEVLVHFTVQAPIVLTEDTRELAADVGGDAVETLEALAKEEQSTFVARVSPATEARQGEKIELVVETTRLHFFDPESGRGIYGDEDG
jgi:multiple sugar transport system ATP-binding protein